MYVKEVTVENQVGLHARPATFFIQKARIGDGSLFHSVPLFHYLCLPNLHIIYGCCSLTAPILFSLHIDK